MADFCQQCSLIVWGEDTEDLKGLTTEQDIADDCFAVVLCERCGPTQVDPEGHCVGHCDDPNHNRKDT